MKIKEKSSEVGALYEDAAHLLADVASCSIIIEQL
jgi:hypothetical protein